MFNDSNDLNIKKKAEDSNLKICIWSKNIILNINNDKHELLCLYNNNTTWHIINVR